MSDIPSPFLRLCQDTYTLAKGAHSSDGRRRLRLRVVELFWQMDKQQKQLLTVPEIGTPPDFWENAVFSTDADPWDAESRDRHELGIVVRTDYADEDAWGRFCARLRDAELEFATAPEFEVGGDSMAEDGPGPGTDQPTAQPHGAETATRDDEEEEESSDDEDEDAPAPIFHILNPATPSPRAALTGISNLAALRLLNDVDVRSAPKPPAGTKPVASANQLVDRDGWQEVYAGKQLWIYDTTSNTDGCVRVVSQSGEMYGTAAGDSWRARASHICELQVNMYTGAMKIDFGGLDRWDYSERLRNLHDATVPIS
ncbi:hypothetical protein FIBSPDRAFT_829851 [Athelia psychrophila]|uniref:Uncharacterized protein n=1 Tax=Athelia psychrophila TaxID=1759441 RepID=A0A166GL82_9AGAM|nr:hypothetical protein FIBSPDRAFT_829851 [Fibularhizoctonia sp. CBS 109695]